MRAFIQKCRGTLHEFAWLINTVITALMFAYAFGQMAQELKAQRSDIQEMKSNINFIFQSEFKK